MNIYKVVVVVCIEQQREIVLTFISLNSSVYLRLFILPHISKADLCLIAFLSVKEEIKYTMSADI